MLSKIKIYISTSNYYFYVILYTNIMPAVYFKNTQTQKLN